MNERSDSYNEGEKKRRQIIGLGEKSLKKSYYPQLQKQIEQLNKTKIFLEQRTEELLKAMKDLQDQRIRAETSERKYRIIVETASEGIWSIDPDSKTTFVNSRMAEMIGCSPDEMIGQPFTNFLPEEDRHDHDKKMENCLYGISENYECRFLRKDGRTIWTMVSATPIFDDQNRFKGSFAMITDISRRKKTEDDLRESESKLRILNENLENTVMKRTHEVHELAKALTLAEQRERQRLSLLLHEDLLQTLLSANLHIGMLLADVKDSPDTLKEIREIKLLVQKAISAAKALAVELNPPILKREGLNSAFKWLIQHFKGQYGLEVTAAFSEPSIEIDLDIRLLLVQIVRELFMNVVKHAKTTEAELTVTCVKDSIHIAVSDKGSGFDVKKTRETALARGHIGLFSTEERLKLIGGQLEMISAPGKGTKVKISLPLKIG